MPTTEEIVTKVNELASTVSPQKNTYSVRELNTMFLEGELDIQPNFQRAYRWTPRQRSSLIESILLDIPVPSIFLAENDGLDENNEHDFAIVDGVQRITTILSFMGSLQDRGENSIEPFKLGELEYLSILNGMGFEDFPADLQRKIKHCPIDTTTLQSTSSADARYKLFLRLNAGSVLSAQELRNCLLVMANIEAFNKINDLVHDENFQTVVQISEKKRSEAFENELVLRFFCQADYRGSERSFTIDFGDYLTEWLQKSATEENYWNDSRLNLFRQTMEILVDAGGQNVFKRYNPKTDQTKGPFSNAAFEFVCSGVSDNLSYWSENRRLLGEKLKEFWDTPEFSDNSGQGINARERFPQLVRAGREFFSQENS